MNPLILFRSLLLFGLVGSLLAALTGSHAGDPTLEEMQAIVQQAMAQLPQWRSSLVALLGLTAMAAYLVASLALLGLRRRGRPLYIAAHLLSLAGYLLAVPPVSAPLAFILNELSLLAAGIVMGMMYLEPVASRLR